MTYSNDFFELDFLAVETKKSGDAITFYCCVNGEEWVHVIDGGYTETGQKILDHVSKYYGKEHIDVVTVSHSDGDHVLGLKTVLSNGSVGALVMNRPWLYAAELIERFPTYNSVDALARALRRAYNYIADLEDIAVSRNIPIYDAFQGREIGCFRVMAPTKDRYLSLIAESDRTPTSEAATLGESIFSTMSKAAKALANLVSSAWNEEYFPTSATNRENEMSLIQYAEIDGVKILLTGDAGREALQEFVDAAPFYGIQLPGIDRFQVPHHGSRRNVSTELLDAILGPRIPRHQATGGRFSAFISSALEDPHHPKKAVERAIHHRDGRVIATEGVDKYTRHNRQMRAGWDVVEARPYPEQQEE
jgi:beta-lactamase superfamily II metal-dependent hydrolase